MILDPTYDTKTIEELHTEFCQLATDLSFISDKRAAIFSMIENRKADAKASAHIAQLTVIEKDALKRALESRDLPQ